VVTGVGVVTIKLNNPDNPKKHDSLRDLQKAKKNVSTVNKRLEAGTRDARRLKKSIKAQNKRGHKGGLPDVPSSGSGREAAMNRRFVDKAGQQYADDILAIGPKPTAGGLRRTMGNTVAGPTARGAVSGGLGAAALADEGQSLEAGLAGAGVGAIGGAAQGFIPRTAGASAWAAEKGPFFASLKEPKPLNRFVLRATSREARKYKKGIVETLEAFSDNTTRPGGLAQTIDKIRNVTAQQSGAEYGRESAEWEEQRQQ
jgi:hypothetical protein